jgi:hypothetical protein
MSPLAAGDLCVIVRTPSDTLGDILTGAHGRYVVLIERVLPISSSNIPFAPFWRCTNVPAGVNAVSWLSLRRVPPAPLESEPIEEESAV